MNWFGSASDGGATYADELEEAVLVEEPPHGAATNPTTNAAVMDPKGRRRGLNRRKCLNGCVPATDELVTEQLLIEDRIELIERPLGKGALRLEHALTALGGSRRDPALFIQEGGHTAGIGRRDICVSLAVLRDQVSKPIAFDLVS